MARDLKRPPVTKQSISFRQDQFEDAVEIANAEFDGVLSRYFQELLDKDIERRKNEIRGDGEKVAA
jgi:hypothetical protein